MKKRLCIIYDKYIFIDPDTDIKEEEKLLNIVPNKKYNILKKLFLKIKLIFI